jgi:hypothetical protein
MRRIAFAVLALLAIGAMGCGNVKSQDPISTILSNPVQSEPARDRVTTLKCDDSCALKCRTTAVARAGITLTDALHICSNSCLMNCLDNGARS